MMITLRRITILSQHTGGVTCSICSRKDHCTFGKSEGALRHAKVSATMTTCKGMLTNEEMKVSQGFCSDLHHSYKPYSTGLLSSLPFCHHIENSPETSLTPSSDTVIIYLKEEKLKTKESLTGFSMKMQMFE